MSSLWRGLLEHLRGRFEVAGEKYPGLRCALAHTADYSELGDLLRRMMVMELGTTVKRGREATFEKRMGRVYKGSLLWGTWRVGAWDQVEHSRWLGAMFAHEGPLDPGYTPSPERIYPFWCEILPIDVCLENDPASQLFGPFSGLPLVGLGSFAVQRSINQRVKGNFIDACIITERSATTECLETGLPLVALPFIQYARVNSVVLRLLG